MELFLISLAFCCKTLVAAITSSSQKQNMFSCYISARTDMENNVVHTSFARLIGQFHQHCINFAIRHIAARKISNLYSLNRQSCKEVNETQLRTSGDSQSQLTSCDLQTIDC